MSNPFALLVIIALGVSLTVALGDFDLRRGK